MLIYNIKIKGKFLFNVCAFYSGFNSLTNCKFRFIYYSIQNSEKRLSKLDFLVIEFNNL